MSLQVLPGTRLGYAQASLPWLNCSVFPQLSILTCTVVANLCSEGTYFEISALEKFRIATDGPNAGIVFVLHLQWLYF